MNQAATLPTVERLLREGVGGSFGMSGAHARG